MNRRDGVEARGRPERRRAARLHRGSEPSSRRREAQDPSTFLGNYKPGDARWLIEGFLELQDRMVVTGGEGIGKGMMTTQLAWQAACGRHPWTRLGYNEYTERCAVADSGTHLGLRDDGLPTVRPALCDAPRGDASPPQRQRQRLPAHSTAARRETLGTVLTPEGRWRRGGRDRRLSASARHLRPGVPLVHTGVDSR